MSDLARVEPAVQDAKTGIISRPFVLENSAACTGLANVMDLNPNSL